MLILYQLSQQFQHANPRPRTLLLFQHKTTTLEYKKQRKKNKKIIYLSIYKSIYYIYYYQYLYLQLIMTELYFYPTNQHNYQIITCYIGRKQHHKTTRSQLSLQKHGHQSNFDIQGISIYNQFFYYMHIILKKCTNFSTFIKSYQFNESNNYEILYKFGASNSSMVLTRQEIIHIFLRLNQTSAQKSKKICRSNKINSSNNCIKLLFNLTRINFYFI
eukprot:TRINITY_DN3915_c1_g1_i4.p1 TRINITY_DN3915_c1_g1~~TRINITY_DN3915_c1_g1_i4.p1  ORF type:complete len:250 (+),score=-24.10 TRINITY_DN3915_c1_g1_i4:101-751(+)